jgi:pimeloyl-ACP methyl ester carboxylesterase
MHPRGIRRGDTHSGCVHSRSLASRHELGPWLDLFCEAGYDPVAPGWPHEAATVAEAREQPDAVANLGIDDVTDHFAGTIDSLPAKPIIIGHSFGGLFAEKLLGQGYVAAAVAIDPAQIKGVLPLPLAQLRAGFPALGNPANLHKAVELTKKEFRFGFGNAVSEEESDALYEKWTIPSPARPLFQAAAANFALHSQAKVDTDNSTRGPLLLISGLEDHTVPDVLTRSTLKQYRDSTAVTELKQFEGRGHSLTVDAGWKDIAATTAPRGDPEAIPRHMPSRTGQRQVRTRQHHRRGRRDRPRPHPDGMRRSDPTIVLSRAARVTPAATR